MTITCEMIKNVICVMFGIYVVVLYIVDSILAARYAKKLNRSFVGYLLLSFVATPIVSVLILLIIKGKAPRAPKAHKSRKYKIIYNIYR